MDITDTRSSPRAATAVTELYAVHALGLVRLAVLLVGDRASAEDIVQDAFLGLYRRWDRLPDTSAPLAYLRVSVLNGCRAALPGRARTRFRLQAAALAEPPPAESAEARALLSEEQQTVAGALARLPHRYCWQSGIFRTIPWSPRSPPRSRSRPAARDRCRITTPCSTRPGPAARPTRW